MASIVIVGAQWGDEGKGKIVDIFTERADMVVRFGGGPNAGHTLVVGGEKFVVRLIPSGILHPDVQCVLAQGMVIDPQSLVGELDALAKRGIDRVTRLGREGGLVISNRAHAILPYHVIVDGLREQGAGAIGTTKRGVGPCYEDKAARRGLTLGMLCDPRVAQERIGAALEAWAPVVRELGGALPSVREVLDSLAPAMERLAPLIEDTGRVADDAVRAGQNVLFEGAQGTLLDVDHGTYPYVTSSHATAGGACTGAGVGPSRIDSVIGLVKAYTTRVGGGPFPTELNDALGERLRKVGDEFGSVTGRARRTGWIDLPALRYAARVNGLDGLALTKLDVLTGMNELRICTHYRTPSGETDAFPIDDLARCEPMYETVPGWSEPIEHARKLDQLPDAARRYVARVEEAVGVPIVLVSVGAAREATLLLKHPFEPKIS